MVIPALALPTRLAALAYMATFVVGTMAAMGGYTAVIGAHPMLNGMHACLPSAHDQCPAHARAPADERVRSPSAAGATSSAIKKSNEGLLSKLAFVASSAAVLAGVVLLLPSLGLSLPFQ